MGRNNWTFAWCLRRWGSPNLGNQKEFIIRVQLAIDMEPRFSLFSFEALNLYEARMFYMVITIWPSHPLKLVVNLGPRLTKETREALARDALMKQRAGAMAAKQRAAEIHKNGQPKFIVK